MGNMARLRLIPLACCVSSVLLTCQIFARAYAYASGDNARCRRWQGGTAAGSQGGVWFGIARGGRDKKQTVTQARILIRPFTGSLCDQG